MKRCYGYLRVSTQRQGVSGLGLESQRESINNLAKSLGMDVERWFQEVESGKRCDRPELDRALSQAKRTGATIICAKIDRLARNVRFLLSIVESGVDVLFCDLPNVQPGPTGKFLLTQMASVAELERGLISQRTKAALQVLKSRGVKLGSARPGAWDGREHLRLAGLKKARAVSLKHRLDAARLAYTDLMPTIRERRDAGQSVSAIADELNQAGHVTSTGCQFSGVQVWRLLNA